MSIVFNQWIPTDECTEMARQILTSMETMLISSVNVLPGVQFPPDGGLFMLIVNGVVFTPRDGSFSVLGSAITWTSTTFSVNPGDAVIAIYNYEG